jgi:BlaI family transcriptional regulator, penicillinase repressor
MTKQSKRPDTISQLGDLETAVMSVVWEKGKATVQEVQDTLSQQRPLAYTTVMTVMSRLAEKGVLNREKEGRAFVYTPAIPQERTAGSLLQSLVRRLYDGATGKAIAQLLETEEDVDDAELERLEQLIRAKREGRKS